MIFYGLHKSDKPEKKYYVELESESGRKKRVYFGASGMKDYTLFNPLERDERRRLYLQRHKKNEDWSNPETAGFWSRHILWGDTPSIQTNLSKTLSKYNIKRNTS